MQPDRVFRVGEKLISLDKTTRLIERALEMREKGLSQQEAGQRLGLDRSFISRLEAAGEIRKGRRVAVIGFPLANRDQLASICRDRGLDFYLLLSNSERWEMVQGKQALEFFNSVTDLLTRLREFNTLLMISSEKWSKLAEALLDIQVMHIDLGPTPISDDRILDPGRLEEVLEHIMPRSEGSKGA